MNRQTSLASESWGNDWIMWHKDSECQTWLSFTLCLTWSSYDNSRQGARQCQPPDDQLTTRCRRPQWGARSSPTNQTQTFYTNKHLTHSRTDKVAAHELRQPKPTTWNDSDIFCFPFIKSVHMSLWKTVRQLFRWFNSSKQIKWWLDYLTQTTH